MVKKINFVLKSIFLIIIILDFILECHVQYEISYEFHMKIMHHYQNGRKTEIIGKKITLKEARLEENYFCSNNS